ncbi:hypothetical protein [Nigerium massiliense]|uniref:hypothetical protein n=1 Tax=Nigerium massiliense TaxID=1522317 RepID=UPI00058C7BB0|nr:hypothetical protein [Nigerium massiliense]
MTFTLSVVLLAIGILSYGMAGVRLSVGSASEEGALRSSAWWWGTALQGCGFILTFFARQELPLLFVQSCVIAALAVTAVLGQILGVHRLTVLDAVAIGAMIAGLILLSLATEPGPTAFVHPATVPLLVVLLVLGGAAALATWSAAVSGLFSGLGFGVGAVAARLLAARPDGAFWQFWTWSGADWLHAALIPLGLAVGQVHLTKGLATGHNVTALGAMYLMSTVAPTIIGLALLGETPKPGTGPLVVAGICLTLLGAWRLVRLEAAAHDAA